ncbi:DddA-like double-stranded DNA deaminase toxin [Lentzea sp. NBRC 102530]|uniref:DddA-like double-stranded DNA deaminase toxin n=1 Tax=Lentzea sp. NBRC 102530 TaxID=3032201 RepID=UPI0025533B0D|nr:DddA-like double-stranded DNA deaminase toxin [Lentzea sp. NBRC 102530]
MLDKAAEAGAALQTAAELAEDAQQLLSSAVGASGQSDAETTNAQFAEVVGGATELHRLLGAGIAGVESMPHRFALEDAAPSSRSVRNLPEHGSREHVERLRRDQPPPVQPRSGRRTHGSWFTDADRAVRKLTSGEDEWYEVARQHLKEMGVPGTPVTAVDVEVKLAVHMARNNVQHATVVLNNTPCKGRFGCDVLVPVVLPEGSTLTVHGITSDGRITRKTYTGGAPAPWS